MLDIERVLGLLRCYHRAMVVSASLLTAEQVAVLLQVPKARVYELAREGLLPAVRLGRQIRVSASALDEWIADGGRALSDGARLIGDEGGGSDGQ